MRFEAGEGWVPVDGEGCVWRHRARGSVGVLVFKRDEDGAPLYEATHQDCFSVDETITTGSRELAIRFAAQGPEARASRD